MSRSRFSLSLDAREVFGSRDTPGTFVSQIIGDEVHVDVGALVNVPGGPTGARWLVPGDDLGGPFVRVSGVAVDLVELLRLADSVERTGSDRGNGRNVAVYRVTIDVAGATGRSAVTASDLGLTRRTPVEVHVDRSGAPTLIEVRDLDSDITGLRLEFADLGTGFCVEPPASEDLITRAEFDRLTEGP